MWKRQSSHGASNRRSILMATPVSGWGQLSVSKLREPHSLGDQGDCSLLCQLFEDACSVIFESLGQGNSSIRYEKKKQKREKRKNKRNRRRED